MNIQPLIQSAEKLIHINHFFDSALKNLNQPISPNPNLAVVSESRAMVYEFLAVRDAEIACGLGE